MNLRRLTPALLLAALVAGVLLLVSRLEPPKPRRARPDGGRPEVPSTSASDVAPSAARETEVLPPRMIGLAARIVGVGPVTELDGWPPGGSPRFVLTDGVRVSAAEIGRLVRAKGSAWGRIPEPGPDGVSRVVLERAGPSITVRVTEADGTPAVGVPIGYGPAVTVDAEDDGWRRTDARGVRVVDDAPAGVLRVRVGGSERSGSALRPVVGRDREVVAVLDPPLVVRGLVLTRGGRAIAGASVRGFSSDGPAGREVLSGTDGSFRWVGRMSERLSLVVRCRDFLDAAVEPPWPDPRGPLESVVTTSPASVNTERATRTRSAGASLSSSAW